MNNIKKIQIAGTSETQEAKLHYCDFSDIAVWHRKVHLPYIAPGGGLDAKWNWPLIFTGTRLSEAALGRKTTAFQLQVEGPTGDAVPVAQALYSSPYYYPGDVRRRCVFIWYISAAPVAALQAYGIDHKFALMAPLLDTAIQMSFEQGLQGRVGLHAASGTCAKENTALVTKYLSQGLTQRTKVSPYFSRPARRDDGKFFFFTEDQASAFAHKYDYLR